MSDLPSEAGPGISFDCFFAGGWSLVVGAVPGGSVRRKDSLMVFWFPVLTLFLGQQASHTAVNWVVGGVGLTWVLLLLPLPPWPSVGSVLCRLVRSVFCRLLRRGTHSLGWCMHCCAEVTESSTNKQHHQAPCTLASFLSCPKVCSVVSAAHGESRKLGFTGTVTRMAIPAQCLKPRINIDDDVWIRSSIMTGVC